MATPTKDHLIRFRCECGKKLKAARDIIGRKVQCTQCPRIHRVPESDRLGTKSPKKQSPASEQTSPAKTNSTKPDSAKPGSPGKKSGAASKPTAQEKKSISTSTTGSTKSSNNSVAKNKSRSTIADDQPSLFINDELAAKEPSLLPKDDDSDSRFKLDPKFDPEPSEQLPAPANSFEFDLDDLQLDTDVLPSQHKRSRQTKTKSWTPPTRITTLTTTQPALDRFARATKLQSAKRQSLPAARSC